jgi:hypothetical protein
VFVAATTLHVTSNTLRFQLFLPYISRVCSVYIGDMNTPVFPFHVLGPLRHSFMTSQVRVVTSPPLSVVQSDPLRFRWFSRGCRRSPSCLQRGAYNCKSEPPTAHHGVCTHGLSSPCRLGVQARSGAVALILQLDISLSSSIPRYVPSFRHQNVGTSRVKLKHIVYAPPSYKDVSVSHRYTQFP